MNGYDKFIKAMSEGIRAFSKGMEILADQLDEVTVKTQSEKTTTAEPEQVKTDTEQPGTEFKNDIQSTPAEKPEEDNTATEREKISEKPRGEVKSKAKAKAKPNRAPRPNTDIGKVYQLIVNSDDGINVDKLSEETGFNRQKIYGIVSNLKKQDKIKSVKQGIYETL